MATDGSPAILTVTDARVTAMREKVARFGRIFYERKLTDGAGGNISSRVENLVCVSPRYAGSRRQWNLSAGDVLVADLEGNILEGAGEISREAKVHFKLHRELGHLGTGVIHAHPQNVLVFAAQARSLPPVLESTRKFGEIAVTKYAPAHSQYLADYVFEIIEREKTRITKQAAAAIAPYHGLFVMGKDLDAALDAVERIDNNAYCILMGGLLASSDGLSAARQRMEQVISDYEASEAK
jgi:L-fuculose-phosphate aldolase